MPGLLEMGIQTTPRNEKQRYGENRIQKNYQIFD